ncbi:MAG: DUF501 domain-containing protein [Synergistaceae bacterium]|nr:DUF501 domain-containing protein [Synergistaceae bacterium]
MFPSFFSGLNGVHLNLGLTPAERGIIIGQASASGKGVGRNFSASLVVGIAKRCARGCPKVLLCNPLNGVHPFPTTFWLSCPHLLRIIGRVEGRNGVASMEDCLRGREAEWARYNAAYALLRLSLIPAARRRFLSERRRRIFSSLRQRGVGGVSISEGHVFVKCIHLQSASFLGMGGHPAAEWLMMNITKWDCDDGECLPRRKELSPKG